jgi:3-methyladenine DNA glycosylase AlkD
MTPAYLDPLIQVSRQTANNAYADDMARYMRNQFSFLGLNAPSRDKLMKDHIAKYGLPEYSELRGCIEYLWELPEREFQYFAQGFLGRFKKHFREEDIHWFERLIITKSWWDTVDGLAAWVMGNYFIKYPYKVESITRKWMDSGNIWLQRTSLLFQLRYKEKTNENLLFNYINELSGSKEFFIQKAIGWALREYSKTYPEKVNEFVKLHKLAPLSTREALKIINKKK